MLNNGFDVILSDSDTDPASIESQISDDSGIEDCIDDMTIESDAMAVQEQEGGQQQQKQPTTSIDYSEVEFVGPLLPEPSEIIERKDIRVEDGIEGVCGLFNLGNTCFMNAMLQCSFATKTLYELVFQGDISQNGSDHTLESSNVHLLIERFQEIFKKVHSGKYSLLYPDEFHAAVQRLHPVFGDYKQHDSQEFLSFLLNSLHDFLNTGTHQEKLRKTSTCELPESKNDMSAKFISKEHFPENINEEDTKRLKIDGNFKHFDSISVEAEPDAGVVCEDNLHKGEIAWRKYLCNDKSLISETMHGQFQSVISCDKCCYVSTTHEPFMFLSLPIPHAMEKEIVITWVPSPKVSHLAGMITPKKYLVVVNKNGCISDVKNVFYDKIKKEDSSINTNEIVLAEVDRSSSVKVLDDRTQLSYLSKGKSIYAIEVLTVHDDNSIVLNDGKLLQDGNYLLSNNQDRINCEPNVELNSETISNCSSMPSLESISSNSDTKAADTSSALANATASSWHTCCICFEDTFDDNLKVHSVCGGMLCHNCLGSVIQYSDQKNNFQCPTCQRFISSDDYKPLVEKLQEGEQKQRLRQLLVPVMFRLSNSNSTTRKYELFGHPILCSLLSEVEPQVISCLVQQVLLPLNATTLYQPIKYDVLITDGTGLSCGCCEPLSSCGGCCVSEDEKLRLKPGCCITVHFHDNLTIVTKSLNLVRSDKSMSLLRNTSTVELSECLEKFADTEVLTDENPWYCPRCQTNQTATKNMSVTRWPDTLIIHLKRFYYEGSQGCKITCPVAYPLTDLHVESLTCPDYANDVKTIYDLYSVVCHTGSLFGGHYTSFTKSLFSTQWFYFNDESFKEMCPSEEYQSESYVLFYQRKP